MMEDRKYSYHELNEMSLNGKIKDNVDVFDGIDANGNHGFYYFDNGNFMMLETNEIDNNTEPKYVLNHCSGVDLLKIEFSPVPITVDELHRGKDYIHNKAVHNVAEDFSKQYMDLLMEVDNCQGAMNDLDVAMEELEILGDTLKTFGVNVNDEETINAMTDEWYAKEKEHQIDEKIINDKKDSIIKLLDYPIEKIVQFNNSDARIKTLLDLVLENRDKINEVCEIIRNKLS